MIGSANNANKPITVVDKRGNQLTSFEVEFFAPLENMVVVGAKFP